MRDAMTVRGVPLWIVYRAMRITDITPLRAHRQLVYFYASL